MTLAKASPRTTTTAHDKETCESARAGLQEATSEVCSSPYRHRGSKKASTCRNRTRRRSWGVGLVGAVRARKR
jgi:hypothetical protein